MILSILIPSLYERAGMLASLIRKLDDQIEQCNARELVEIVTNVDNREKSTGKKRNELIEKATGVYCIGHDDDDSPPAYYVEELLNACKSDADCIAISGIMTTNGMNEKRWYISKDLNYCALIDESGREIYHRYSNHITAIKTEIARKIKFTDTTIGEDFQWATELRDSGLLKTEYKIDRFPMYHYKFIQYKKEYIYFSQNQEDKTISDWFGQYTGTILEIGSNNGECLSNSLHFINKGWQACCVEPSPKVFPLLSERHKYNDLVNCYNVAIGDVNGKVILHDSGELLGSGDRALVSSVNIEETKRWSSINMKFEEVEVDMVTFDTFMGMSAYKKFDIISIDAEGNDLIILSQMDLDSLGCKCICVEWNGLPGVMHQINQYVEPFGFRKLAINSENVIFVR